jgi:ELWxxDGT repeat protein
VSFEGRLVFTARHALKGREIWSSRGTPSSTKVLRDIVAGSGDSDPSDLVMMGGRLYFGASHPDSGRTSVRARAMA